MTGLLSLDPEAFMYIVSVNELPAGLACPHSRWTSGALVVAAWLIAIYFHLAPVGPCEGTVRDVVMATGARHVSGLARTYVPAHTRERIGAQNPASPNT